MSTKSFHLPLSTSKTLAIDATRSAWRPDLGVTCLLSGSVSAEIGLAGGKWGNLPTNPLLYVFAESRELSGKIAVKRPRQRVYRLMGWSVLLSCEGGLPICPPSSCPLQLVLATRIGKGIASSADQVVCGFFAPNYTRRLYPNVQGPNRASGIQLVTFGPP
ncbi:hypothetical protein Pla52n_17460 [Stieleria varia]|uniref:Uncharacterized protein n=1 Tax=Stieleria varia TaxID=2528005 RepID=A0A5C6B291_9BACT|nr:hypothetical protein Pla52n_17460 [Stieleria varia]